jgi:hypothetical protein
MLDEGQGYKAVADVLGVSVSSLDRLIPAKG